MQPPSGSRSDRWIQLRRRRSRSQFGERRRLRRQFSEVLLVTLWFSCQLVEVMRTRDTAAHRSSSESPRKTNGAPMCIPNSFCFVLRKSSFAFSIGHVAHLLSRVKRSPLSDDFECARPVGRLKGIAKYRVGGGQARRDVILRCADFSSNCGKQWHLVFDGRYCVRALVSHRGST